MINPNDLTVVKCKDCVYRKRARPNRKGFLVCPASGMEITDDDFCSYGERACKNSDRHYLTEEDVSVISIEQEDGCKYVRFLGDSYCSEDGAKKPYRFIEYTYAYLPLEDVVKDGLPDGDWYTLQKQYIEDCSFEELCKTYLHYDNGDMPKLLPLPMLSMDTPCGCYILFNC